MLVLSSDSAKIVAGVKNRGKGALVAGRYRLTSPIRTGGMGTVWLAHDLSLDANCAVKLIDDDRAADQEIRHRFECEAKVSAQLRGAHVIDVFDFGEWDGTYFIAMEYLEGEDLRSRLERMKRLDFETTYRIVAHVTRALMNAHAQGIIHRDLKPDNIFLVEGYDEEVAKVLDFGIAQNNAHRLDAMATCEGVFLGTPCYVSPEQARGRPIDHRTDLWSLGVIVFECLTGHLPFYSDSLGDLMALILYEPIPKPTSINPDLPPDIDAWWERAAARDRRQRFQSAKEMADQLGEVLGLIGVPTVRHKQQSSYPSISEQSGVVIARAAPATAVQLTPESRGAQQSIDPSALPANPTVAQVERVRSRFLSLQFILPAMFLLLVVGAILGVWLRDRAVDPGPVAHPSVLILEMAPKDSPTVPTKTEPAEPLTVDSLPLVPPNVPPGKSAKDNGRTGVGSTSQHVSHKRSVPPAPLPIERYGRDYGI